MPEIVVWIVVAVVFLAIAAFIAIVAIKISKMTQEERQELVKQCLIGLCTVAENYFIGEGRGQEKLAMVQEQFYKTAPWFTKLVFKFCGVKDLTELIEVALTEAKETWQLVNSTVTTEY